MGVHDLSSDAVRELVKKEVERMRRELMEEVKSEFLSAVQSLEAKVAELSSRVAALEDRGER